MSKNSQKSLLRTIPNMDVLLVHPDIASMRDKLPHIRVVGALRKTLDSARAALLAGEGEAFVDGEAVSADLLCAYAISLLEAMLRPSLRTVLNGTGVVLHTNLGRAPIAGHVLEHTRDIAAGYTNLEYDLDARSRGSRHVHVEAILRELLGVEAALVVNNCASAVLLMVTALARGREVIVSRGELIEIGGSFRIPEVMEVSGAKLREVGTTNRTRIEDYERAITDDTALMLKAYRSNFAVVGFTESVPTAQMAALGVERGVSTALDLGSGLMIDLSPYGIQDATTVQEAVDSEVDLVCFSGDKLLGGPQAGIIVGSKEHVEKLRKDPLTRALRVDKLTISALETTLLSYLDGSWKTLNPTLAMLTMTEAELQERAKTLHDLILAGLPPKTHATVGLTPTTGMVGGGTLPCTELPSTAVTLSSSTLSATALERALREASTPLIARIDEEIIHIDVRTLYADDLNHAANTVLNALQ
jgi:L-seryl-tRNA(Ser) seleniumtransferase